MRVSNVLVAVLGLGALALAVFVSWRWRRLPLTVARPDLTGWRATLADATRSLGAIIAAGALAGLLVLGVVGRLVMRLLAATSGDGAQGRLTEAGERVGEITFGGTVAFLLFVGLGGGVVSALGYLVVRRWLPATAGRAGVVVGVILLGTLGVLDPLSADNVDFAILEPTPVAVGAVAATGLLFAVMLTALAARLDRTAASTSRRRWLPCIALVLTAQPLLAVIPIAYVGGRVAGEGRLGALLGRPTPLAVGRALVGAAAIVTTAIAVVAAVRITTA